MRENRIITRCIIVILLVMVLGVLGIVNVAADEPGGPHVISGIVYTSDGKNPGDGHEGAYAAVIIEHNGAKSTYEDPNGLERDTEDNYWYVVTIPAGGWDIDDTYWIWVDGTGWGDENFTCRGNDDPDVNSWQIESLESERRDVRTGDYNFKPLIAIIFAIILAVVGIIVGIARPLRIPFSGRPQQPADLVEEQTIVGEAVIPEPLAEEEEAPAAAEEERTCPTCGGKMEFIPEYGSWYCYTCKKYPDEEEGEAPPPPEEELPPPEDELPPPEDESPPPEEEPKPEGGA